MPSETSHLVPKDKEARPAAAAPSLVATGSVYGLAIMRAFAGLSFLAAPSFFGGNFYLPIAPQAAFLGRLVGGRDLVLGELTWFARGGLTDTKRRAELRHVLLANVAVDTLELASLTYGFATGHIGKPAAALFGGVALAYVAMGIVALRDLRDEKDK